MQHILDRFGASWKASLLSGLALFLLAGSLVGQEQVPQPPQQQLDPETQALLAEFQELQQRVGEVQTQALQENAELSARQMEIGEMVNDAMEEANPDTPAQLARMDQLEQEAMIAQQEQDQEALQQLMTEAQQIQGELQVAQQQALAREDIQAEIDRFQDDLIDEMESIEPETTAILDRLDELSQLLQAGAPPI